jgi:hypothetical protein
MAGRIAYLGNIATQGLVLDLDAAIQGSYPKTGSLWTDISGNNNNGTLVNGPAYTGSDYGAIVFDNTDDYIVISSSPTLAPRTGDFSNDFWINPTAWANNNWQPIQVTALTNGLWIGQNATNQFIVRAYGNADRLQYAIRPTTGSWTNVSITRNNGLINLYYNGTPVAVSSSNQDFLQGTTYLGSDGVPSGGTVYFNGRIATDKYYNIGLSQFQVWQNFNAYKSRYGIPDIVTDGLVLNLDAGNPYSYLSGSSGTTWTNTVAVSSSISGTLVNGTTYSNGAMVFDGVDDYVNLPSNFTNITSSTYVFALNLSSVTGSVKGLIGYGNNFSNYTCNLRIGSSGDGIPTVGNSRLSIRAYNPPSSIDNTIIGQTNINTNTTYIVTFVMSATSYKIYINGIEETLTVFNGTNNGKWIADCSSIPTNIAISSIYYNGAYSNFLSGKLPVVEIYNRALTQAEITQNFNALRGRYGI